MRFSCKLYGILIFTLTVHHVCLLQIVNVLSLQSNKIINKRSRLTIKEFILLIEKTCLSVHVRYGLHSQFESVFYLDIKKKKKLIRLFN